MQSGDLSYPHERFKFVEYSVSLCSCCPLQKLLLWSENCLYECEHSLLSHVVPWMTCLTGASRQLKILLLWRGSTQPGQSAMWARGHQKQDNRLHIALVYMCGHWSENLWHLAILKNWLFLWSVICCLKAWHCILGLVPEWKTSPNWYIILVCSPTIPASITHHPSPQRK